MATKVLTPGQARLEVLILDSEADAISSGDLYAWLKDLGLSDEVAIRLKGIAEITAEVGKRVINVGKIVLLKIIEFIKAHPKMTAGIALGAAIGALVNAIPWIGPVLAPIATVLGVTVGALAGHRLDKATAGEPQNSGLVAIGQDIIEIATAFFKLFVDIFNLVFDERSLRGV